MSIDLLKGQSEVSVCLLLYLLAYCPFIFRTPSANISQLIQNPHVLAQLNSILSCAPAGLVVPLPSERRMQS